METIGLSAFLMLMLYLMSRVLSAFFRVRDEGISHSEELLRSGVTFRALLRGKVPDRGAGSLIPAREGLLMEADEHGHLEVSSTRTIARDVI